jgi:hypothetical protein
MIAERCNSTSKKVILRIEAQWLDFDPKRSRGSSSMRICGQPNFVDVCVSLTHSTQKEQSAPVKARGYGS